MIRKAMKCIVEIDLHVVTCPGTFLRDHEYVYLHVEMLGLAARTKSVPPSFPLFYHERLRFERTFLDCTDPGLVASMLKGEDIILELRQHTDYVTDGNVLAHCSSNTHDFIYPAIPPYYGTGREILLYKTSKFKPLRVTGEPVKLEFSTKTIIKEVPDYDLVEGDRAQRVTVYQTKPNTPLESSILKEHKSSFNGTRSRSTPNLAAEDDEIKDDFVIRRKDDKVLSNRDFSTYVRPRPRRSLSPVRSSSMRRSASPSRSKMVNGSATVEALPAGRYTSLLDTPVARHYRARTDPLRTSAIDSLRYALDDLDVAEARRRHNRRYRTFTSPRLIQALSTSKRIQARVDDMIYKNDLFDSEIESDVGLDILRESLREERNTLNDAIKEADREAFYRSLNRTR